MDRTATVSLRPRRTSRRVARQEGTTCSPRSGDPCSPTTCLHRPCRTSKVLSGNGLRSGCTELRPQLLIRRQRCIVGHHRPRQLETEDELHSFLMKLVSPYGLATPEVSEVPPRLVPQATAPDLSTPSAGPATRALDTRGPRPSRPHSEPQPSRAGDGAHRLNPLTRQRP
jgi:hypothetical protein